MSGRKKGVSIGAAMKQRMVDQEVHAEPVQKTPATPVAPVPSPPPPLSPIGEDDPLESFNTRLPRSLQRRLKIHVVTNGTKIQTVLAEALEEYLAKQGE